MWWLALLACGTADDVAVPAASSTAAGWPAEAAAHPEQFDGLMERSGRDGWVAYHRNDFEAAIAGFNASPDGDRGRARAEFALGVLHSDLDHLAQYATDQLFAAWDKHGGLPAGSAPAIAALSSRCHGGDWKVWAAKATAAPAGVVFLAEPDDERALWPQEEATAGTPAGDDPLVRRRFLHQRARKGDISALASVALQPLVVEPADGFERTFWDPCLHHTLSEAWFQAANRHLGVAEGDWKAGAAVWAAPDAGLGGSLFSPWLTSADLAAEIATEASPGLLGARQPGIAALGIGEPPGPTDSIDAARDEARSFLDATDAWRATLLTTPSTDGQALVLDLRLVERFRQEWLVTRARLALSEGRPRQALAYAQLARDVATPDVGPTNSPSLLAVLAEAELRNGHTRESLDALKFLAVAHPEVLGVQEVVGDLSVLESIDRRGDSKEN